ncbi:hypothetical protein CRG98_002890 [Punica granatum]|uniref:Uncharacterized protein n=1 Tax=Punica granatum TaxID=22663 RepID=A0A2I0L7Q3_PUNGR|nr:hypothetical protein CRG98_002890 [Punica granatum]
MAIGRLSSSIDYEELRQARILENKARLASLGLQKTIFDLRAITSPTKSAVTNIRKWPKKEYTLTSLRRSNRLKGIHAQDDATMAIGRLNTTINYEDLRRARILENKARLASLGLQQTISDLRAIASPAKSAATSVRKHTKEVYSLASLRRSDRLKRLPAQGNTGDASNSLRRSARLKRVKNHLANPFPVSAGRRHCAAKKIASDAERQIVQFVIQGTAFCAEAVSRLDMEKFDVPEEAQQNANRTCNLSRVSEPRRSEQLSRATECKTAPDMTRIFVSPSESGPTSSSGPMSIYSPSPPARPPASPPPT